MGKSLRPEDFRGAVPIGGRGEQDKPDASILREGECFKLSISFHSHAMELYSDARFGPNTLGIFTITEGYMQRGGEIILYKQLLVMALGSGSIHAQIVKQPSWWSERQAKATLAT